MTQPAIIPIVEQNPKAYRLFAPIVVLLIAANIAADYLYTLFQNTAFYLSESALFSSYWILFVPLVLLQWRWMSSVEKRYLQLSITLLIAALHLVTYPGLIRLLSALFYDHTFAYWPSFQFGLSAYLVQSLVIYGYGFAVIASKKGIQSAAETIEAARVEPAVFLQTLMVKDGANTQTLLVVNDIQYFSASPPYVTIHLSHKKYLHTATLKALEAQLDNGIFVRIHKSCLLNISTIVSVQSRKNGDYDVTLTDQTILRVSRTYAANLKEKWLARPQVSLK